MTLADLIPYVVPVLVGAVIGFVAHWLLVRIIK